MPFMFDHCIDPMMQAPAIRQSVAEALMTLGCVPGTRDATAGAMWSAVRQRQWVAWSAPARDMLIVRRFAHRPDSLHPLGLLVIGVALNGEHYRITCEGQAAAEDARTRGLFGFAGIPIGQCRLGAPAMYRAHSIQPSRWAGGATASIVPDVTLTLEMLREAGA